MPRGDGTGPAGMGQMTGRGAGFCAGYAAPGYANYAYYGCGFGGRRFYGRMPYAAGLPRRARFGNQNTVGAFAATAEADEKEFLENQKEFFERRLAYIEGRLAEIEENAD